jgi:DNA-binding transcriptional MerR regulator
MTTMGEDRPIAEELLAVPIETAARLAGVSVRQVRYWDQTKLVVPSIRRQQGRIVLRLYGFQDLVELLAVAAMLRSPGISLQHVRKVVAYLTHQRGYGAPLREVRYAVAGGEVFFMDEFGNWAGGRAPNQIVEHRVLPLEEIRDRIRQAPKRPAKAAGRTVRRRRVAGFQPVFEGTRIPVRAIVEYLERGYDTWEILKSFPELTPKDIDVARKQAGAA